MNPLNSLIPAIYVALTTPALMQDGGKVGVYEHLATTNRGSYVLLESPTCVEVAGSLRCRHWTCTLTLRAITQFGTSAVSSIPVEEIAGQIMDRLLGDENTVVVPRLALANGFDCSPSSLELHSQLNQFDGQYQIVQRLLRFRWEIYYHRTLPSPGRSLPFVRASQTRLRIIHA